MGFVDSLFHLNIQLINANLILVHHQPHGLVSKMFFETLQVGTMCCVLVANPLMVGLARLVYCLLSICNKFGHL